MRRLLLTIALLAVPFEAWAEACVFTPTTTGTWSASATCTSCVVSGCTLDATDTVTVSAAGGGAIRVTGADVHTSGLTVAGTLTVDPGARLALDTGGDIAVSDGGRFGTTGYAEAGAVCPSAAPDAVLEGLDSSTPAFTGCASDVGPTGTVWWEVGDLVHCATAGVPTDDCAGAGDKNEITFHYPDARYDNTTACTVDQPGCQFYHEGISALAVEDWIVFWDSTGQDPAADFTGRYRVTEVDATNRRVTVKLDGGCSSDRIAGCPHSAFTNVNNDGHSLTEREVGRATTTAAFTRGTRVVTITDGLLTSATGTTSGGQRKGMRWLTCPDAQGVMPGWSALILETRPAANPDEILLDPVGVRENVGSGVECRVDYGWRRGDRFFVVRPAHVVSNTEGSQANREDNKFTSSGILDLSFMFFEGFGSDVNAGADLGSVFDLDGTDSLQGDFASFVDSNNCLGSGAILGLDGAAGKTLTGWSLQGSEPDGAAECHGAFVGSQAGLVGNNGAHFDGWQCRYIADDCYLLGDQTLGVIQGATITRQRCAGISTGRDTASQECLSENGGGELAPLSVTVRDLLIQDGVHWSPTSFGVGGGRNLGGSITVTNLVSVANDEAPVGDLSVGDVSIDYMRQPLARIRNLVSLRDQLHSNANADLISPIGRDVANATVYEMQFRPSPTGASCGPTAMLGDDAFSMRRILYYRPTFNCAGANASQHYVAIPRQGVIEDIAIIDTTNSVTLPLGNINDLMGCFNGSSGVTARNATARRVTIGWRTTTTAAQGGYWDNAADLRNACAYTVDPGTTLVSGLWVHGFWDAATDLDTTNRESLEVLVNNLQDGDLVLDPAICITNGEDMSPPGMFNNFVDFPAASIVGGAASMTSSFEPVGQVRDAGCGSRSHGARPGMYFMRALGFDVTDFEGGTAQTDAGGGATEERRVAW